MQTRTKLPRAACTCKPPLCSQPTWREQRGPPRGRAAAAAALMKSLPAACARAGAAQPALQAQLRAQAGRALPGQVPCWAPQLRLARLDRPPPAAARPAAACPAAGGRPALLQQQQPQPQQRPHVPCAPLSSPPPACHPQLHRLGCSCLAPPLCACGPPAVRCQLCQALPPSLLAQAPLGQRLQRPHRVPGGLLLWLLQPPAPAG